MIKKNHNLFITVRTVLLKAMIFGWSLALGLWPCTYYHHHTRGLCSVQQHSFLCDIAQLKTTRRSYKLWEINKTTVSCEEYSVLFKYERQAAVSRTHGEIKSS